MLLCLCYVVNWKVERASVCLGNREREGEAASTVKLKHITHSSGATVMSFMDVPKSELPAFHTENNTFIFC